METLLLLLVGFFAAAPPQYADLERQGEAFMAEKSFAKAHAVYEEASHLALSARETRWVGMRLADTAWRADESPRDEARKALQALTESDDHDRAWAEANESLGDYQLLRRRDVNGATSWYIAALDWWGGSDDL